MSAKTPQVKDKGKKTKKQDDEKESELMDYLKKHLFIDKFKESVKEMLDMDPNLPKDPVRYDKALRKRRDKVIEDFVRSEFQFLFNVAEYAKVLIDSWKGTYGNCLCGGGLNEPPIPEFLMMKTRQQKSKSREDEEEDDDDLIVETEEEDRDEVGEQEGDGEEEDLLKEELDAMGEMDEAEEGDYKNMWAEGGTEEVEHEEELSEEQAEEELTQSEDDPCTCIQDFMYPFPPEDFDYPLGVESYKN